MTDTLRGLVVALGLVAAAAGSLGAQVPFSYVTQEAGLPCVDKAFSLRVHFNDSESGPNGMTQAQFQENVDVANAAFAPICVRFEVCEYLRVENYRYATHERRDSLEQAIQYGDPNRIDVFVTERDSLSFVCGRSSQGGFAYESQAAVMITDNCQSANRLAHELGHYFGLYDTFERRFGRELVNGDSCQFLGDLICDTPADPYIEGAMIVWTGDPDDPCRFTFEGVDRNGQYYVPHTANAMSSYSAECRCGFTREQLAVMARNAATTLRGIW